MAGRALVGVLALQGGFEAHLKALDGLGAATREVRVPADLEGLTGLVLPGGESTTIRMGVEREGLAEPIGALQQRGVPILGTCAGMIMMSRGYLELIDIEVQRKAFGRQLHSFEEQLVVNGFNDGAPVKTAFIRAPKIVKVGKGVDVLAAVDGVPVAAKQGNCLALAFHPELTGALCFHRWMLGNN